MERVLETQMLNEEKYGDKPVKPNYNIKFDGVSFSYTDISDNVINNMNFEIEANKTTAIVGLSGSGKTTIMKLALGLHSPKQGKILLNEIPIDEYDLQKWRKQCGVVMQDGYIFTDTIKNNITLSDNDFEETKYINAIKNAAIYDFIDNLPIKHETVVGKEGLSLSSGQRQRILIARMIYKNPDFIFMDEATNSLDSETERFVLNNLNASFDNKTRLVIAHRLNTVKNADKILVINDGNIIETGDHNQLLNNKSFYYNLVKDQLL
jgi:ATP-binding cassette subfamily B protein